MTEGTLIIGGGVIGLSLGWKLALRGEPVTLFERGETGREASWAAAGMLAPATEIHYQEDLHLELGLASLELYPRFVEELEAFTGLTVGYRREGALAISLHADETEELRHLFEFQQEKQLPVRWLTREEVHELEPALAGTVAAGVLCPMDHQVDNRLLVTALRDAFLKAGGTLRENCPVERVCLEPERAPTVVAGGAEWSARRLVLAAGSWSGLIPGLVEAMRPLVRPVKGQMVAVATPGGEVLRHVIRTPDVYIVPRSDGRLIVGATVEEMGFDDSLTVGGMFELLRGAWRAVPGLYELPIQQMWCGFRPGSRDNAPLLGETDVPGFYVATGHFRNGILNTPFTAQAMSELILDGTSTPFLERFSPRRFAG